MSGIKQQQHGFGLVQIILLIVIAGIVVGTGYYVWQNRNIDTALNTVDTKAQITNFDECVAAGNPVMESYPEQCAANGQTFVNDKNNSSGGNKTSEVDTTDWKLYTNKTGGFSFNHPTTWNFASNPDSCSEGLVLFGVKTSDNQSTAGKCAAGGARAFGQMSISWKSDKVDLSACGLGSSWKTDSTEELKIAGVPGIKTSGTYIANDEDLLGREAEGNTTTQYCFVAEGKLYIANYTKWPDYPDALQDFNAMVTQTLTIL